MKTTRLSFSIWTAAVLFLVAAVLLRILSRTVADPDLWGHVLYGIEHLRSGALPRTDPYSYLTEGHEWINHEWASELIFGFLYLAWGPPALIALKASLALVIVGLLYRHLWRQGLDPLRAGLLVILVAFALSTGLGTVRPQMFTHLFFTLLLLTLVAAEDGNLRQLLWAPLLLLLWINFHGGVLAGLGVLLIWSGARAAQAVIGGHFDYRHDSAVTLKAASAVTAFGALALLVNPYGWRLPEFLLRTATVPRPEIVDWQPVEIWSPDGALYLLLVGIAALAVVRSGRPRNIPLLSVLVVTAVLPLLAMRHLQLFAIALAVLAGDHLSDAWGRRNVSPPAGRDARLRPAVAAVAGIAGFLMVLSSLPNFRCIRLDPEAIMAFPVRATALMQEAGFSGRLVVTFGWGQYAIWHLYPALRVSMDGRRETVYPDEVYERYLRFHRGVAGWEAFLEDPPADLALLPTGGVPHNLLALKSDWRILHRDSTATIFVRLEAEERIAAQPRNVGEELLALPSDGRGTCFPASSRPRGRTSPRR